MRKLFNFIPVAFAALAMVSCSNDDLFGTDSNVTTPVADANEALAVLPVDKAATRYGITVNPQNPEQIAFVWTQGDKFNLYSKNSLKFNVYSPKESALGKRQGLFEVAKNNLETAKLDPSESENLYAIVDDNGKGLVHSFFTNDDGEAMISLEIPSKFTQNADAEYDEEKATQLPMPVYATPVTINSNGGVTANFKYMCGLFIIDASELPVGTQGVAVVAKQISGTFEANLDDAEPTVAANSRYTYKDYIEVDFDAAITAATQARKIYVPLPAGTYDDLYVYAISTAADITAPQVTGVTWAGSVPTLTKPAATTMTEIMHKVDYELANGKTIAQQPKSVVYTGTTFKGLSDLLYNNMDGETAFKVSVDPSAYTDSKLYIPVDANKTGSDLQIEFTAALPADLTIVEATTTVENNVKNYTEKSTAASASAATSKTLTLTINGGTQAINAYLPTTALDITATAAQTGNVTVLTSTDGLITNGAGFTTLTTTANNTGSVDVKTGNIATLTAGAKTSGVLVEAGNTVTTLTNPTNAQVTNYVIEGTVTSDITLGANADATRYAGSFTVLNSGTVAAVESWGTGDINIYGTSGALTCKNNCAITIGDGETAASVASVSVANCEHSLGLTVAANSSVTGNIMYGSADTEHINTGAININGIVGGTVDNYSTGDVNVDGAITAALNNNNTGNIVFTNVRAACGNITNNAKGGTITISGTNGVAANMGTITQNAPKNVSIENIAGTITALTIGTNAACTVTLDKVNEITTFTNNSGKAVPASITDSYVATINYTGGAASEFKVYGSGINAVTDPSNFITIKAYWNGVANNKGASNEIFTAGQLAGKIAAGGTKTISEKVIFMDLNGEDGTQIWKGANVTNNLTLNCNNVPLIDMNLTDSKFKDDDSGVGFIYKVTGTATANISNVIIRYVSLNTTKKVNDAGILIGKYSSTGNLTVSNIVIENVESFSTAGKNVGGLVGTLAGGTNVIGKVSISASKLAGAGNVGGVLGLYNGSGSFTIGGATTADPATISIGDYEYTGTYSMPSVQMSPLYGTFSNVVGGVQGTGTVNVWATASATAPLHGGVTATKSFLDNTTLWTALKFYGNWKTSVADPSVKHAFYPTNNFVGFRETGSINIDGVGINTTDYKAWHNF